MPKYWLVSDRDNGGIGTGRNVAGLTYFVSDGNGPLTDIANWDRISPTQFRTLLKAAADAFPALEQGENEKQSHVTILVHGFNNSFVSATGFYQDLCNRLFTGADSLGLCILYDWPSQGNIVGYEPDRECAGDLTDILAELFDWLIKKQQDAINSDGDPKKSCKAKVSLIAHSMGNYVVQKAMAAAWTRKNQPLLVSLLNRPTRHRQRLGHRLLQLFPTQYRLRHPQRRQCGHPRSLLRHRRHYPTHAPNPPRPRP
jgi:hypothetical protein